MSESKYELCITASDLNGITGWHSFSCYIEETPPSGEIVRGIPETFGCHPNILIERFDGNVEKWRSWVADGMKRKHIQRSAVQASILDWRGKKFAISEPLPSPSPPPPPPAPTPVQDK